MSRFLFPLCLLLALLIACDRDPPKSVAATAPPMPAVTPKEAPVLPSIPSDIANETPGKQPSRSQSNREPRVSSATPGQAPSREAPNDQGRIDDGRSPGYDGEWTAEDDAPPIPEPDFDRDPRAVGSHWGGIGAAQFGMDVDEIGDASQGEFLVQESGECFYANGNGPGPAMMFERGRFVRYEVDHPGLRAPGGGQVGMDFAEILERYGRVERRPHKYTDGEYLRVESPRGNSVLLFETDPDGVVTSWRMGVEPQIDYVEGCS